MSLRQTINYPFRKLLYLWIRTEVLPNPIASLDINPEITVIYVLEPGTNAGVINV